MTKKNTEYMGSEGYALMGAAFEVHKELWGGLGEELYHESLEIELGLKEISYSAKEELEVFYKGHRLRKKYIPDMLVYKVPSVATLS